MDTLQDTFLRCSNPVFVQHVRNLRDLHPTRIDNPEKLFAEVQSYYHKLVTSTGGWLRTTKQRSAFLAQMPELSAILGDEGYQAHVEKPKPTPTDTKPAPTPSDVERDAKGRIIDRNPPTDGNNKRKRKDGRDEFWCSKCRGGGRWGSHLSSGHDQFVKDMQDRFGKKKKTTTNTSNDNDVPSMHRATFCMPIASMANVDLNYMSDTSF